MDYDDFELQLSAGRRGYELEVECAEGEDRVPVEWGPQTHGLTEIYDRFHGVAGRCVSKSRIESPDGEAADSDAAGLDDLENIGRELFSLLFPTKVAILWHRCRARAAEGGRGLRLRIHVDLRREAVAWFGTLPWELLYDEDSGGFLALDGRTPVVRYLDMRRPRRTFPVAQRLRVLVVMPEPYGAPRIDLARERENLVEAWDEDERVELVFPDRATFDGVREAMAPGPIHAIHFMGHGVFDERTGWGGLVLDGSTGGQAPIVGLQVGDLVRGVEPPPALVVLNGCESGRTSPLDSRWAFAGAASALMEAGVQAVVAMQLPIADDEAIHFSEILYRGLQDGHPVDRAVSEARLSLRQAFQEPTWATPALFMRVPDGRLFEGAIHSGSEVPGPSEKRRAPVNGIKSTLDIGELDGSDVRHVGREGRFGGDQRNGPTNVTTKIGKATDIKIEQVGVRTERRQ
jgi:hypothetical protein